MEKNDQYAAIAPIVDELARQGIIMAARKTIYIKGGVIAFAYRAHTALRDSKWTLAYSYKPQGYVILTQCFEELDHDWDTGPLRVDILAAIAAIINDPTNSAVAEAMITDNFIILPNKSFGPNFNIIDDITRELTLVKTTFYYHKKELWDIGHMAVSGINIVSFSDRIKLFVLTANPLDQDECYYVLSKRPGAKAYTVHGPYAECPKLKKLTVGFQQPGSEPDFPTLT